MQTVKTWKIIATYINRKTGQRHSVSTTTTGTINDVKRKSKQAFRSTKTARVLSIKVVSNE